MMKLLSCALLISVLALPLLAQQESLPIGPGDVLTIQVFETPDLNQSVRVTDAGDVPLVLGGSVSVGSMTPGQAAAVIEKTLVQANILNHPHVTVNVAQYATLSVSVLGQVRTPGVYPISTGRSVLDVLAMAGGVTELADRRVTIERRATHERITYLLSNSADAALEAQVTVYPGDRVVIPKVGVVYVMGDVGRPGGYPMATNDFKISVLQAVAMAAGVNHTSVPSHAMLIRKTSQGYTQLPLSLNAMQKGKVPDMQLIADDIIYVPFSFAKNFVLSASSVVAEAGSAAIYRF